MKEIFTVVNHSIYHVHTLITQMDPDLLVHVADVSGTEMKKCDIILIPSVAQFIRLRKRLEGKPVVVFVFDNPVQCEYIKPSTLLDARKANSFRFLFETLQAPTFEKKLNAALANKKFVDVDVKRIDIIPHLLNETKPSLISPIMGWLYSVKDGEQRIDYQVAIFKHLVENSPTRKKLLEFVSKHEPKSVVNKLVAILDDPKTARLQEVVAKLMGQKVKGKGVNYNALAKEFSDIDMFDVKYVLKHWRKTITHKIPNLDFQSVFSQRAVMKAQRALEEAEEYDEDDED